ncbi:glycosyltransferase [Ectothiorhodospiraceae bacterium BW-2]|nr:glycosyltransferase [Ectothiorhodospiraceae bacterium BW-2]
MKNCFFSIVTVCLNSERTIRNTVKSVLCQEFFDFEYVVLDGGSSDATLNIISSYEQEFKDKGIRFYYCSGKDNGVYDAMNKSLDYCCGEWLLYLNADDSFYSCDILCKVYDYIKNDYHNDVDVYYGDVLAFDVNNVSQYQKAKNITNILKSMPFCHQSVFVKTKLQKKYLFDLDFAIGADYNFFLNLYLDGAKFNYMQLVISCFSLNGLSMQSKFVLYDEFLRVKHKNNVVDQYSLLVKIKRRIRFLLFSLSSLK